MKTAVKPRLYDRIRKTVTAARKSPEFLSARKEREQFRHLLPPRENKPAARLYIEDLSGIPFLKNITGIDYYQQRIRTLAGTGDMVALTHPIEAAYERYNREMLELGAPDIIDVGRAGGDKMKVAESALADRNFLAKAEAAVRSGRELHIFPYMGSPVIWRFADILSGKLPGTIRVFAPLFSASRFANDKARFLEMVSTVLGGSYVPFFTASRNLSALCASARNMALRFPKIALKMPDYASSMGIRLFDSSELLRLSARELNAVTRDTLTSMEWNRKSEVMVTEWREDTVTSPSVQLWIPPAFRGYPVIEGVFEQLLEGKEKVFNGSMPAVLEFKVERELKEASFLLGIYLQQTGYTGRCSFDTIVTAGPAGRGGIKFVECNGRWGGTSIPMSLISRVFGTSERPFYMAKDHISGSLKGKSFADVLARVGDLCYNKADGRGRYIFYNTGGLARHGKLDVIVLGRDREECLHYYVNELSKLLG